MGNGCELSACWYDRHLWIFVMNESEQVWELTIKFWNEVNFKLSKFYKTDDLTFLIYVPPKSKTGTYAKRITCEQVKFNWDLHSKWINA